MKSHPTVFRFVYPVLMVAIASLLVCLLTVGASANSGGPPNGRTGAPTEGTCADCHSSFPLNSGDGLFTITAPSEVIAGETITVTVSLEDPGQSRWGFEITPLAEGTCTITDPTNTQLSTGGSNSYVKQTSAGTYNGTSEPVSWSFDWTAPETMRDEVVFYAAGNAANGNGGTSGDYIYTTSWTVLVGTSDMAENEFFDRQPLALVNAPNPFVDVTRITYDLPASGGFTTIEIFDATGARVSTLVKQLMPSGTHHVSWDGRNRFGHRLPSGMYLCKLSAGVESSIRPLILLH